MQPQKQQENINKNNKSEHEHQNEHLNQYGRPKQKVIFYQLTQQMKQQAKQKLMQDHIVPEDFYQRAKNDGQKVWDKFYKFHKCSFFKDRTYLEREIQPITLFKNMYNKNKQISEFVQLGCGVGNTLFPLLRQYPCFNYFGFDISAKAINLIQQQMTKHPQFKERMKVSVANLVTDQIPYLGHGDLSTLIFVLSAIVPEKHYDVIQKIADWMKPGSFFYFRDYGRYDFGQLNLSSKGNRKVRENFYMKNDGVCVYYFQLDQVEQMLQKAGLIKIKSNSLCKLLQNRKRDLKMYRVWLQCLYYKPPIKKQMLIQLDKIIEQQSKAQTKQQQQQGQQSTTNRQCNEKRQVQGQIRQEQMQMQMQSKQKIEEVNDNENTNTNANINLDVNANANINVNVNINANLNFINKQQNQYQNQNQKQNEQKQGNSVHNEKIIGGDSHLL